jgi:glucose-6-phosphate isomerase
MKLNYTYSSVKYNDLTKYSNEISEIVNKFNKKDCLGNDFLGWYEYPSNITEETFCEIENAAKKIKEISDVLVVCGIGGSYLGARAVIEAVRGFYNTDVEIIYLGNTFDEKYISDTLKYLENKSVCVNVISKSGTTLETATAYRLLKSLLVKKYGENNIKDRIYVTTDEKRGCLREETNKEDYCSFVIPDDVGGRFSVFTPVGLLPLAASGVNIREFVKGAKEFKGHFETAGFENNLAYQYAAYRYNMYLNNNITTELFVTYSPYLNMISEWWKQLFGESEGKEGKGLFPASVNFSTDLHSLGQFIQQGNKMLFITQLKNMEKGNLSVEEDKENLDGLNYLSSLTIDDINKAAQEGTNKAHYNDGGVNNLTIELENVSDKTIGELLFFFMCSCMISAYLLKINPFDQPGVEFYKQEMKKILKKE